MINNKQHIKVFVYALCMVVLFNAKQQAQIYINGAGIININGGATSTLEYLVLNSAGTTPITIAGTTGGIMMETEYSVTKYNLGILTTGITVPYYSKNSGAGVQFPLAVTGISGAAGAGNLQFSSTNAVQGSHLGVTAAFGSGFDNVSYMPTTVNNMSGYNPPPTLVADNSLNCIDRFWVIDALGYTTSPAVSYQFGYVTAEANANGGNSATLAANLEAMAFDQGALTWQNYGPTGANTTGASEGNVSGVSVGAGLIGNVFRSWTLVNKLSPLPVKLLGFTGTCLNNGINITWSTAVETNSKNFTLEKSFDGQNFTWLADIVAAGNSVQTSNYVYFDNSENAIAYYRLSETDKNGNVQPLKIISVTGCNETSRELINAYSSDGGTINMSVYSLSDQPVNIAVHDVTGRIIYKETLNAVQGNNTYSINPAVATGVYLLEVQTNTTSLTKRVPLLNN